MRSKKIVKLLVIFLILFVLCYMTVKSFLTWKEIYQKLKELLDFFQSPIILDKMINCISIILSAMIAGIATMIGNTINLAKLLSDRKKDKEERAPQINIFVRGISTLRSVSKDNLSEIVIGDGKLFVYIDATIKNCGKYSVEKVTINDQVLDVWVLNLEECHDFDIKICRDENVKFKDVYKLILKYKDDKEIYYNKQYKLRINEEKLVAEVFLYKKQKKCKG